MSRSRTTRGKLSSAIIIGLLFAAVKAIGLGFVLRYASDELAAIGLANFLFCRRAAATAATFLQFGASNAALRFYGESAAGDNGGQVLVAGLAIWALNVVGLLGLLSFLWRPVSELVFTNCGAGYVLVLSGCVLITGTIIGYLAYALLLGERRVWAANTLEMFNAVGFLAIALLFVGRSQSGAVALLIQGLLMNTVSLGVIVRRLDFAKIFAAGFVQPLRKGMGKVLTYGWPRSLAGVAEMAMFTVAAWTCRHDSKQMADLLSAMAVGRVVQAVCTPVSHIIVVVTSAAKGAKEEALLNKGIRLIIRGGGFASLLVLGAASPLAASILGVFVGPAVDLKEATRLLQPILVALPAYLLFNGLKGVIDVVEERPYTLMLALGGLVVSVGTVGLMPSHWEVGFSASVGVSAGVCSMGIGAAFVVRRAVEFLDWIILIGGFVVGGSVGSGLLLLI